MSLGPLCAAFDQRGTDVVLQEFPPSSTVEILITGVPPRVVRDVLDYLRVAAPEYVGGQCYQQGCPDCGDPESLPWGEQVTRGLVRRGDQVSGL